MDNINKIQKKLYEIDDAAKDKEIRDEYALYKLIEDSLDERNLDKTIPALKEFMEDHKELQMKTENKFSQIITGTNDNELKDFINKLNDGVFPKPKEPELSLTEKIGRIAKFQASETDRKQKFEISADDLPEYENQIVSPEKVVKKAIFDSKEEAREIDKVTHLLDSVEDEKSYESVLHEIVQSLKKYYELKDDYIKISLDLYAEAEIASDKANYLNKIWLFLSDKNL